MAVPSGNNDKKNTAGGAFVATTEGGTILGNETTGDVITKALALKDNATAWNDGTKPKVLADGLQGNQKALSAGTFAYEAAGKYVIAASSSTLSGVASNKILITGRGETRRSIAQFEHMYGAQTVTAFRQGQFSWTNTTRAGASLAARINWMNVASGGMDTATVPTTMSAVNMYAPGGSARDGSGANAKHTDVAANPTRAIPGRLVIKANFITSELDPWTATEPGSDFYKYSPITGI
jgi:hypothetical protein